MKKTRKLIPALAMLLISAVLMSTASYAWFSMNDNVTANGMQIQAMADQTFLLISTSDNIQTIQGEYKTVASIEYEEGEEAEYTVYPSTILSDAGLTESTIKFHRAIGQGYSNGAATEDENGDPQYYEITSNLNQYVVKHTFYITVAKDAIPASNIIVRSLSITSADSDGDTIGLDAVKVAVTTATAGVVLDNTYVAGDDATVLSDGEITDTVVLPVNVYIYYDGENELITTANAAKLEGVNVSITFGVKGASQP